MIRVGVAGCGHWGPNLIRNFHNLPGAALAGLCDKDEKRLQAMRQFYPAVPCVASFDEFLALPGMDAVAIATPLATHSALTRAALNAGKHVLVEKPLAATVADARDLAEAARKAGLVLCVGHVFLFNQAVRYVKRAIEDGQLGETYYFHFTRTNLGPVRDDTNALWDLAAHDISIAMYWMGAMPLRARATGHTYLKHDKQDVVFAELVFDGGVVAHMHVSWLDPCKIRRTTVVGSKKMLVYCDTDSIAPVMIYDKRVEPQPYADTMAEFQMSIRDGDIHIPRLSMGEPLKTECEHFLECVRERQQPLTDGENGVAVVRVLAALQESIERGGQEIAL